MTSTHYTNPLGYLACFISLPLFAQNQPTQDIQPELETITVVSSKVAIPLRQLATSVSIIDQQQIDASANISLAEIISQQVGIGLSTSGGVGKQTTLRIRGEDGFRSKVYLDGIELSDPTAPQVSPLFDDLLSSFTQRVEILRGPQGLMYGADAGGVISITSRQSTDGLHGQLRGELGRYDSQLLNGEVGFGDENGHVYLAAGHFSTDGFNAQTADTSQDNDGYENTTLHLKGGVKLAEQTELSLVLRDVDASNQFDTCSRPTTFELTHNCRSESVNSTARLALNHATGNLTHKVGIARTDVERLNYSDELFSYGSEGQITRFDYTGTYQLPEQQVVWGLDHEEQKITSSGIARDQLGVYAEYQGAVEQRWYYTAGLRLDDNDTFGTHTSYRLSTAYLIPLTGDQELKFKSALGTGFRAPSLYEQDFNDGDNAYGEAAGLQLKEELSRGFDLGLEYSSAMRYVSAVWFSQKIENEIFYDIIGYQGYLQNNLSSKSQGLELEYKQSLGQTLQLWSNYTYNQARTSEHKNRLRRPKHIANLGLRTQLLDEQLELNLSLRRVIDLYDIGYEPLENYTVVNVSASYAYNHNLSFTLRAENLLDKDYQEIAGYNSAGQSWYLGFRTTL